MFRGRFIHTIDAKNRMSLPAPFRQDLQRRSEHAPILTNAHECLFLYAFEDWCDLEREFMSYPTIQPDVEAFVRMMISGATDCPIDRQGRILVPPHLRAHANLEREVTIAGVGPKIELWDKARFEANLTHTLAHYHEIASAVGSLGKKES